MTPNQLMTMGALGFAAFAVVYLTRGAGAPAVAVSPQPGQRQRDAGMADWNALLAGQAGTFNIPPGLSYSGLDTFLADYRSQP